MKRHHATTAPLSRSPAAWPSRSGDPAPVAQRGNQESEDDTVLDMTEDAKAAVANAWARARRREKLKK